jgi:hypothetical protein
MGYPPRVTSSSFNLGALGRKNPTQLLREFQIVFTRNMRIGSERHRRITVTYALHPDLKRNTQAIHDQNISVTEGV